MKDVLVVLLQIILRSEIHPGPLTPSSTDGAQIKDFDFQLPDGFFSRRFDHERLHFEAKPLQVLGSNPVRSITRPDQVLPFQPGPVEPGQGLENDLFQINTSEYIDLTYSRAQSPKAQRSGQSLALTTT